MRLKIHGGTVNHLEPSLCYTCRFATIIKGQRLRDEIVECGRLSDHARITFVVSSCTGYSDRTRASVREMEEIAWILRSDHNLAFAWRCRQAKPMIEDRDSSASPRRAATPPTPAAAGVSRSEAFETCR